jgi:hypothetical protein
LAQQNLKKADEERVSGLRSALRVISGARTSESGESGLRSMCPFCGSRDPSPEAPCCSEWNVSLWTEAGAAEPEAPVSRRQQLGAHLERLASVRERLGRASQLLVTLLASSIAALVVSLTMQSRVSTDHTLISVPKAPTNDEGTLPKDALLRLGAEAAKSDSTNHVSAPPQVAAEPVAAPQAAVPVTAEAAPAPSAPVAAPEPVAVVLAPKEAEAPPAAVVAAPPPAPAVVVEPPQPGPSVSKEPAAEAVNPPPAKRQPAKRLPPKPSKVVTARAVAPSHPLAAPLASRPEETTEAESPVVTTLIPERDVAPRAHEEGSVTWRDDKTVVEVARKTDAWVALRRGMSPTMVRRLLGEPKWKRHLVDTEVWLYQENSFFSDGWVAFSETEGGLLGWRHP